MPGSELIERAGVELETVLRSAEDDLFKYVFRVRNDLWIEAIDYTPSSRAERWDICISTQSGCAVGCKFWGTGAAFIGSLTAEEIVAQVQIIIERQPDFDARTSRSVRILFMSMGEPGLNVANVVRSAESLWNLLPNSAIIISTVGIDNGSVDCFITLAKCHENLGLQFSIHSPLEEQRNQLIPFHNKLSLGQIASKGRRFRAATGRAVRANFILFDDWLDPPVQTRRIEAILSTFSPEDFHINLSPLYSTSTGEKAACRRRDIRDLLDRILRGHGYTVTTSKCAGLDVGGSCGQLWHVRAPLEKYGRRIGGPSQPRSGPRTQASAPDANSLVFMGPGPVTS